MPRGRKATEGPTAPAHKPHPQTERPLVHAVRLPTPFAIGDVNSYVLPGSRIAIVDTGPATPDAFGALQRGLRDHGIAVTDIEVVAVTHGHLDHLGLAGRVHEVSGARVVGHPRVLSALADFPRHWQARVDLLERAAEAAGAPSETSAAAVDIERGREGLGGSVRSEALASLDDGAQVQLGDSHWTAVHTPGHSGDHISLLHGASGGAFTGDLILRHLGTVPYLEARRRGSLPNPMAEMIASWRRLGRLPLSIAWPGHGHAIRAHRILVARRLVAARGRLQEARAAISDGAATIWDVAGALDMSPEPDRLAAVLGETVALVSWLVDRGLVTRDATAGVIRYAVAKQGGARR